MIVDIIFVGIIVMLLGVIVYLGKRLDRISGAVSNLSRSMSLMHDKVTDIRIETLSKFDEIMLELKEPPFDDGVELNKDNTIENLYTNEDGVYSRKAYLDKISVVHKK